MTLLNLGGSRGHKWYNCRAICDWRWKRETVGAVRKVAEDGLRFGWIETERVRNEPLMYTGIYEECGTTKCC